jgi:hypothetical protein
MLVASIRLLTDVVLPLKTLLQLESLNLVGKMRLRSND